mmetsp:Transcript_6184/g.19892  ORF Transcript_6184/g.19892 Transcript_6184/m.19892 type:complete len:234 (+) Transcript_6184:129-830(+)
MRFGGWAGGSDERLCVVGRRPHRVEELVEDVPAALVQERRAAERGGERGVPREEQVAVAPVRVRYRLARREVLEGGRRCIALDRERLGVEGAGDALVQRRGVGHHAEVVDKEHGAKAAKRQALEYRRQRLAQVEPVEANQPKEGALDEHEHELVVAFWLGRVAKQAARQRLPARRVRGGVHVGRNDLLVGEAARCGFAHHRLKLRVHREPKAVLRIAGPESILCVVGQNEEKL